MSLCSIKYFKVYKYPADHILSISVHVCNTKYAIMKKLRKSTKQLYNFKVQMSTHSSIWQYFFREHIDAIALVISFLTSVFALQTLDKIKHFIVFLFSKRFRESHNLPLCEEPNLPISSFFSSPPSWHNKPWFGLCPMSL